MPESGRRFSRRRRPKRHKRESACKRGYDRQWRNVRKAKLDQDPLCEDCLKNEISTPAKEVHHIRKIIHAPELRLEIDNLMSLCERCHDIRSARGE